MIPIFLLLAAGTAGLAWVWWNRPSQRPIVLAVVAAGGLGFQVVHVLEHVAQAGVWMAHPNQPPFLTPWAIVGRDALAVGGDAALGNELLHLVGNLIFLAGLVALALLARRRHAGGRALRLALVVQSVHVAEHLALTLTAATMGEAVGITTAFGLLDAGGPLWALRVNAHFALNGVATVAAVAAVGTYVRAVGGWLPGPVAAGPVLGRPPTRHRGPGRGPGP